MRAKIRNGQTGRLVSRQRGVMLLEALIGILLFSMGILALVALQAVAIKNTADAKYRADAAFLANQIIARMWMENPTNLPAYAHYPTKDGACSFSGSASSNVNVTTWLGDASSGGTVAATLPGADADMQQITIDGNNIVTVTLCWKEPDEATAHSYVAVAQINGTEP